jgi:hypothetical protein
MAVDLLQVSFVGQVGNSSPGQDTILPYSLIVVPLVASFVGQVANLSPGQDTILPYSSIVVRSWLPL